jgi:sugar O-acyltransferase (sialic acid O-acetyltransferase NeuD family)
VERAGTGSTFEVYVVGTNLFAADVLDYALDAGLEVAGLLEPYETDRVGTTIHERAVTWLDDGPPRGRAAVLMGTGEHDGRRDVVARLSAAGFEPATLVHPRAHIAPTGTVEDGALIGPGAVVGARARVGAHAVLGRGTLVGHHTDVGEFATLNPGANLAGTVRLGADVFVGMGAVVRDHLTVGDSATIAMGAVVVRDVPARAHVRGVPALPHGEG